MTAEKEYTYTYESGNLTRAAECNITVGANEIITARDLVNSILYFYDSEGKMTQKQVIPAEGIEQYIYYEYPEDDSTVVKIDVGLKTIMSHSKTDSFGRKVFDELQLGTGFVSRQLT